MRLFRFLWWTCCGGIATTVTAARSLAGAGAGAGDGATTSCKTLDEVYMPVLSTRKAKIAHPTGDPMFEVMQPFPSAFTAEETDPFLM